MRSANASRHLLCQINGKGVHRANRTAAPSTGVDRIKSTKKLLLVLALLSCPNMADAFGSQSCGGQSHDAFPNIQYVGQGYNVVKGNPRPSLDSVTQGAIDPGWYGAYPVIDLVNNQTSADGKWCTPYGFKVLPTLKCSYSSTSSAIHSSSSYSKSLAVDAKVSGRFGLFKFSASVDYQKSSSGTQASQKTYVSTSAACGTYTANLAPFTTLPLTVQFRTAVGRLSNGAGAAELVAAFGTHVTSSVIMGAKSTYTYEFTSDSFSKLTAKGLDVHAAASLSFLVGHVSASTSVGKHSADAKNFSEAASTYVASSIGPPAPGGVKSASDTAAWEAAVRTNPMPIQYDLMSITDFLTKDYFPNDPGIATKQRQLGSYLDTYCQSVPGCQAATGDGYWDTFPATYRRRFPHIDPPFDSAQACGASIVAGGRMFVFGGSPASTRATVFDINGDPKSWAAIAPMPVARRCATATTDDGAVNILVFGGTGADGATLSSVAKYNIGSKKWTLLPPSSNGPSPAFRSEAGAVSLSASANVPSSLRGHSLIVGGVTGPGVGHVVAHCFPSDRVEAYDPILNQWSVWSAMPTARRGLGLVVWSREWSRARRTPPQRGVRGTPPPSGPPPADVYAIGGHDGTKPVATFEALNLGTRLWRSLPPMQFPRYGASVGVVGSLLIVAGGVGASGPTNVVEQFDLANPSPGWRRGAPLQFNTVQAPAAVLVDAGAATTKLVVGGGRQDAPPKAVNGRGGECISNPTTSLDDTYAAPTAPITLTYALTPEF